MVELITPNLLYPLAAAAIGFMAAWLLRGIRLGELRERVAALGRDVAGRDQRLAALHGESDGLRTQLGNEASRAAAVRSELASVNALLAAARTERDDHQKAAAGWQQRMAEAETRAHALEHQLVSTRDAAAASALAAQERSAAAASERARLQAEIDRLAPLQALLLAAREQNASDARVIADGQAREQVLAGDLAATRDALERERGLRAAAADAAQSGPAADLRQRMADTEARLKAALAAAGELGAWKSRFAELDSQLQSTRADLAACRQERAGLESRQFSSPPGQVDDLQSIHGVGPKLSKLLNRLGIYLFRQVACWSEEDIDFFDAQLGQFHGRIRRENWVRSATEQHHQKYGEWLGAGAPPVAASRAGKPAGR
jgi:predicted flap endonuclease-1-like 5' DNA nuclease